MTAEEPGRIPAIPVYPMNLQPGTRLGPYEVIGFIGAGAMGEVFQGPTMLRI